MARATDPETATAGTTVPSPRGGRLCRVRVWFGEQVLCDYAAPRPQAERYATAMRRRFFGLHVTIDASVPASDSDRSPLPDNSALWPLTVK